VAEAETTEEVIITDMNNNLKRQEPNIPAFLFKMFGIKQNIPTLVSEIVYTTKLTEITKKLFLLKWLEVKCY